MDPVHSARARRAAAIAACLLAACSARSGARRAVQPLGPEDVSIWMAPVVRWDGGGREVAFALENVTDRTLALAAPDPAHARVDVFDKHAPVRLCGVEPRPEGGAPGRVELAPAERLAVRVDLSAACAAVPPGEYRVEVSYRAPAPAAAEAAGALRGDAAPRPISGTLATSYGELLVSAGEAAPPRAARRPPPGR